MAGVGAARKLIEGLEKIIAKRKAALQSPPHIEHFAKKYGLSSEEVKKFMKQDLDLSIKRYRAAQDYSFEEQMYNTRHADAPYTKAAVDSYKKKEQLREIAFTEPQLRGPKLEANKQKAMNDLALEIEERKNDLRLSGQADPKRANIQQQIQEMEARLDAMEQGAENPNLPKQKITYSNNAAGQARKEEHVKQLSASKPAAEGDTPRLTPDESRKRAGVVNPSNKAPSLKEVREQAAKPEVTDTMVQSGGWMQPGDKPKINLAKGVHAQAMKEIEQATDLNVLRGKAKHKENKLLTADTDTYSGEAIYYMSDELEAINRRIAELEKGPSKASKPQPVTKPQSEAIDPALENDALMNQWSDQGYAAGGLVKPVASFAKAQFKKQAKQNQKQIAERELAKIEKDIESKETGLGFVEEQMSSMFERYPGMRDTDMQGGKIIDWVHTAKENDINAVGGAVDNYRNPPAVKDTTAMWEQFAERYGIDESAETTRELFNSLSAHVDDGRSLISQLKDKTAQRDAIQARIEKLSAVTGIPTSTLIADFENNKPRFQDRIDNPSSYPYIQNADGSMTTHQMATGEVGGKHYAFPMVQLQDDGKLKQFEDWREALSTAVSSGNALPFDTAEQAEQYAQNYKTPEFQEYYDNIETRYGGGEPSAYPGAQVKRPYEHTSSYGQMSPELQSPLEARDYKDFKPPKGPEPDASDRLLAIREGLGSIPGINAELLGLASHLNPIAYLYDKATGANTLDIIPRYFEEAKASADRAYMSNPEYMNEDHSVHPKSTDEAVGYYGAWAADPIGWVGLKGGPALKVPQAKPKEFMRLSDRIQNAGRKMHDPNLPKGARNKAAKEYDELLGEFLERKPPTEERRVNPQAVDESRRNFMKGTAATAGIGAVGGIASLKYMTKGAEAAKTPIKLLSYDDWIKAGKPKGEIPDYVKEIAKADGISDAWRGMSKQQKLYDQSNIQIMMDETVNRARYNNYIRSMHKEIPLERSPERAGVDNARNLFREQMQRREALLNEQAQMQRRADIAEIKEAVENLKDKKLRMTPDEYENAKWLEIERLQANDIKNYGKTDDEIIDMHKYWGTDTETTFQEIMANNPQSKMRLKDVQKALDKSEGARRPGKVPEPVRKSQNISKMTDSEIKREIGILDHKLGTSSRFTNEDDELLYQLNQELIRRSK